MPKEIKPKEYKIETLDDLANVVTTENADRLADDVRLWLKGIAEIFEKVRETVPEETKDKKNSEIAEAKFIWVDDGESKHLGLNVSFELRPEHLKKDRKK